MKIAYTIMQYSTFINNYTWPKVWCDRIKTSNMNIFTGAFLKFYKK